MRLSTIRHSRAARGERGFSLVLTVIVLFVVTALLGGAFDAVFFNSRATRNDLDQKRALLAADAGLSIYDQQLNANPNYWDTCPSGGATGLTGLSVPGSTDNGSTEYYSYKTLPATGSTGCNTSNPIATTIEPSSSAAAAGSFRAEFTGSSGKITRTIVAQFQPPSFLNYVYFTNYEIGDPTALNETGSTANTWSTPVPRNDNNCGGAINFITGDSINGPMHSNDDLAVCGTPSFGSTSPSSPDTVEAHSIIDPNNCANTPTINGAPVSTTNQPTNNPLQLPANDAQLLQVADGGNSTHTNGCYTGAGCVFTGPTTIQLTGSTMTVTNAAFNGGAADPNMAQPGNGVIYVTNSTCTATYSAGSAVYGNDAGCGDATVWGNYSSSLTIGTDNSILINGNIVQTGNISTPTAAPSGSTVLGLIANKFVRVVHPVTSNCQSNTTSGPYNGTTYTSTSNVDIDAAILALNDSFINDNFECGTPLGTLTIWGAVAQNFRGFVGTESNGQVATGYLKNYNYDTRLATLSPPSFLNPVTDWSVARVTECGDASGAC
jgi:hypothetical protein